MERHRNGSFWLISWLCCSLWALSTCKEGTPSLVLPVNEAQISGIDSVYVVAPGATIRLEPSVTFTEDDLPDSTRYRYEWFWVRMVGRVSGDDYSVVGTQKTLQYKMSNFQGAYDFLFRVTDLQTNLFTEKEFRVFVANSLYEGWLLLGQNGDESSMDLLSYQLNSGGYRYISNVLDESYPGENIRGQGTFVDFTIVGFFNVILGGVVIGTTEGLSVYDGEDMGYANAFDHYLPVEDSIDFTGIQYGGRLESAFFQLGDDVYFDGGDFTVFYPSFKKINQVMDLDGMITPFKAAPFMAIHKGYASQQLTVLFDKDAREFLWFNPQKSYCNRFSKGRLFDFKTGKKLLFLGYSEAVGGQYTALLRDTSSQSVYLAKFSLYDQQYYEQIDVPEIEEATQFALRPSDGALFYSTENRLYAINDARKEANLMQSFDQQLISKIKFNSFLTVIPSIYYTGTTASEARYQHLQDQLIVCAYNPTQPANSGVFMLYDIDPGKQTLHETFRFEGLPKIIDVVYKER